MNPNEIRETIAKKNELCFDKDINSKDLFTDTTELPEKQVFYCVNKYGAVVFSRWALGQLCSRFKVPILFYDRCSRALKKNIFTEHITDHKKDLKLRFSSTGQIRAVFSDKYGVIDDIHVYPLALDILEEQKTTYQHFVYDDDITSMLAIFPEYTREFVGSYISAGIQITNSEIGRSAVWVEPVVYYTGHCFANRRALRGQSIKTRIIHK